MKKLTVEKMMGVKYLSKDTKDLIILMMTFSGATVALMIGMLILL